MRVLVTKCFEFEACHHLPDYPGKCANLHGHSYKLEVSVSMDRAAINPQTGMVLDFSDLKSTVEDNIVNKLDHTVLNDTYPNPTAEIMVLEMASVLQEAIRLELSGRAYKLERIKLWETSDSYAEVDFG